MQGIKLTIEKETIEELASEWSDTQAAKRLGIAVSSFFLLRKRYGIPSFTQQTGHWRSLKEGKLLHPSKRSCHPKTLSIKSRCFEVIDSEEKAYYLGLLAADGHVNYTAKGKYLAIELQDPDSIVLQGLEALLNASGSIEALTRAGKKDSSRLRVYSRELVESLMSQGITLNTEEHHAPENLPRLYRGPYLRGLIDGDGHIRSSKSELYLCGCSSKLMRQVSSWVYEELGITCYAVSHVLASGKPFYKLRFGGNPRSVVQWIYQSDGPVIPRKKKQALEWLEKSK